MLTTAEPFLTDLKKLYSKILPNLTIRLGSEELLPMHGSVATYAASALEAIRKTKGDIKDLVMRKAVETESLFHAEPYIYNILASPYPGETKQYIPIEKHERLIKHLEKLKTRQPIII